MSKQDKKEEVLKYVRTINKQMEEFLRSVLESRELDELTELDFLPNQELLNVSRCWVELDCDLTDCPAYNSSDYRCWLVDDTLCGGQPQGTFARKLETCYSCRVFQKFTDTEVRLLYENLGILFKHLGDTAGKVREFAVKDSLTGLYNRDYLNLVIEREIRNADRAGVPLSIILLDLNKFKNINDTYGHLAGDEMLKEFSVFLRKYTRMSDLLFRIGGDEFMLLMTGATEEHRQIAEERLLDAVTHWNESNKERLPAPLFFGLGGATAYSPINLSVLMAEANRKMHAHKQALSPE
jgi:diguanylate cyclase (GGDEF)-like protein